MFLLLTQSTDGLQITSIKDDKGNLISFTVSGGTNIKTLLDRFMKENCDHDYEKIDCEGFGTVFVCKKCGDRDYD